MDVNDFLAFARRSIPSSDDTADIKKDLAKVKSEITEIQLVLEHDTNKKIAMIAEGNFNLTRKPDEALKGVIEREMLLLRAASLENELRQIKNSIKLTA